MAIKVYVDLDATGANDGTSAADAYNSATALADAFGDAIFVQPAADDHEIYIADVAAGEYTISAEHSVQNSGSRTGAANDYSFKVIGCDTDMNPITTKGTYVTIRATAAMTFMFQLDSASQMSNTLWSGIKLDSDANATYCLGSLNATTVAGYNHTFANCMFMDGNTYGTYLQSDMRGILFIDCHFEKEQASGTYNTVESGGAGYIRCTFKAPASGQYAMYHAASGVGLYYLCDFDANNRASCFRPGGSGSVLLINCNFHDFSTDAIYGDDAEETCHLINCTADGILPASDKAFNHVSTSDMRAGLIMGCLSNITNSGHKWTDHDDLLDPYILSGAWNADDNSGSVISDADPRWSDRAAAQLGMPDVNGIRAMTGAEFRRAAEVQAVSKIRQELIGSPITGAY